MPNRREHDHIGNFTVVVELEGLEPARFASVEGMDSETEVIELRSGALGAGQLAAWRQAATAGAAVRRTGTVTRYGAAGVEQARIRLFRAWPSKLSEGSGPGPSNVRLLELRADRRLRVPLGG